MRKKALKEHQKKLRDLRKTLDLYCLKVGVLKAFSDLKICY